MRLINTSTLELKEFTESERPDFAILSHRWEHEEVSLQQFRNAPSHQDWRGYKKVKTFCAQALQDGYEWGWADTCCIDKASTDQNELSEAINSMFKWYRDAGRCYVYLSDVVDRGSRSIRESELERMLRDSKWFTRGWTLQELIAPRKCSFFDAHWVYIGSKRELASVLARITRIDVALLEDRLDIGDFSIAQKMSWAAFRHTTKPEDRAYSLCGLFDIKLPTIYGEGHEAFSRLQRMLMERSTDQSLFAWLPNSPPELSIQKTRAYELSSGALLAPSPDCFHASGGIRPYTASSWADFWLDQKTHCRKRYMCSSGPQLPAAGPYGTNNMGFEITLMALQVAFLRDVPDRPVIYEAALYCFDESRDDPRPCTIILSKDIDGVRRVAPFYLGRVAKRDHSKEHSHWNRLEILVPTPLIWAPPGRYIILSGSKRDLSKVDFWRDGTHDRLRDMRRTVKQALAHQGAEALQKVMNQEAVEAETKEHRKKITDKAANVTLATLLAMAGAAAVMSTQKNRKWRVEESQARVRDEGYSSQEAEEMSSQEPV